MTSTRSAITVRIDAVIWSLEGHDLRSAESFAENLRDRLEECASSSWDTAIAAKIKEASCRGISQIRRGAHVLALKEFRRALREWLQQVERS
jgi:hypothetical protein